MGFEFPLARQFITVASARPWKLPILRCTDRVAAIKEPPFARRFKTSIAN
jgi:hypothetical protein